MPAVTVTAAALGTLLQQQLVVDVYIVIPVMAVTVTKSNSVATVKGTAYNNNNIAITLAASGPPVNDSYSSYSKGSCSSS